MSSASPSSSVDEHERKEILELLASMGVKLPNSTKLPLAALQERLARALDCAQRHDEILGFSEKIKRKDLPPWRKSHSLREATSSNSLEEVLVGDGTAPVGSYNEVRIMLSDSIGRLYEAGIESVFVCTDTAKDRLVKIKINGVLKVTEDIPLIAIEYTPGRVADDDEEGMKILNSSGAFTLFQKLLEVNSIRTKEWTQPSPSGAIASYLLPLGPLSQKDIGSLSKDTGCIVCGKPGLKQCSRCQSVLYCGTECQTKGWQQHKPTCLRLALNTGTWVQITYASDLVTSTLNRTAQSANDMSEPRNAGAESKKHGDDPFLVKIQLSSPGGIHLFVYDRSHSFEAQFWRSNDPENFQRIEDVVATGYLGLKIYLWARRVSKDTLSICLDRIPDQSTISW